MRTSKSCKLHTGYEETVFSWHNLHALPSKWKDVVRVKVIRYEELTKLDCVACYKISLCATASLITLLLKLKVIR